MSGQPAELGRITKLVRIPSDPSSENEFDGYGILRTKNGKDVFFIRSAVEKGEFAELEVGNEVLFSLEAGPFSRASHVWTFVADRSSNPSFTKTHPTYPT